MSKPQMSCWLVSL